MNKYVLREKLLRTTQIVFGVALFVAISGFISYFTCDGHTVIGHDLNNLSTQRNVIKTQTVLYVLSLVIFSSALYAVVSIFLPKSADIVKQTR